MPSLTIRKISPDDREQWRRLWDSYNAFYGRIGPTALAPAITDTTWSRFFDASEPVDALVAVNGRELLGLAHYLFHRSTTSIEPTCYLQDLFTRPDRRGNGIGRLLIEGVCQEARRGGARRVYWQTHQSNAVARSVYEKLAENSGFIVYRIQF
jgi:GNAT superfamily N-acetyltransferase